MLITAEYARENARLHATDKKYGSEGFLWATHVAGIATLEDCASILDYGCGKGTLAKALRGKFDIGEYDPGVPGKDQVSGNYDLVVSLDVLEHIEPKCLDEVIQHLESLTKKYLFVVISTKPSKRIMSDGRDTHLSLHDDAWWSNKFSSSGFIVQREWNTGLRLWIALLWPAANILR